MSRSAGRCFGSTSKRYRKARSLDATGRLRAPNAIRAAGHQAGNSDVETCHSEGPQATPGDLLLTSQMRSICREPSFLRVARGRRAAAVQRCGPHDHVDRPFKRIRDGQDLSWHSAHSRARRGPSGVLRQFPIRDAASGFPFLGSKRFTFASLCSPWKLTFQISLQAALQTLHGPEQMRTAEDHNSEHKGNVEEREAVHRIWSVDRGRCASVALPHRSDKCALPSTRRRSASASRATRSLHCVEYHGPAPTAPGDKRPH